MCKVTKVIHLEQVTVFVKRIKLNRTCSVGYNILPVAIAVVLFHAISPGYGGLSLKRHDLWTHERRCILLNQCWAVSQSQRLMGLPVITQHSTLLTFPRSTCYHIKNISKHRNRVTGTPLEREYIWSFCLYTRSSVRLPRGVIPKERCSVATPIHMINNTRC